MQRAHLFGTESPAAQPIRTLPVLKGREERDGRGRIEQRGGGMDGWWLVVGGGGMTVCGAGRRHVISQTDKFQSSAKAKSRGY